MRITSEDPIRSLAVKTYYPRRWAGSAAVQELLLEREGGRHPNPAAACPSTQMASVRGEKVRDWWLRTLHPLPQAVTTDGTSRKSSNLSSRPNCKGGVQTSKPRARSMLSTTRCIFPPQASSQLRRISNGRAHIDHRPPVICNGALRSRESVVDIKGCPQKWIKC